jgi:hypothetical protein
MRRATVSDPRQPGFPALLENADRINQARAFDRATAHLPGTMAEGIAHYRRLLERHHEAILTGDERAAKRIQGEASLLAQKLNGGQRGYLADDDAPGCVLQRETAAAPGTVPLWGQVGSFIVEACGMRGGSRRVACSACAGQGASTPMRSILIARSFRRPGSAASSATAPAREPA